MADMIGADPNELRNLAAQMRGAADELDGHSSALTSLLGSVDWVGDFASRFLSSWSGGHRVRLQSTSQFIRDAASELERNADEQVNASDSAGTSGRVDGTPRAGGEDGEGELSQELLDLLEDLAEALGLGGEALDALELALRDIVDQFGDETARQILTSLQNSRAADVLRALDNIADVTQVVVDFVQDFADPRNAGLPIDERVFHAATDALVRFGLSEGVERAVQYLTPVIMSALPGVGTAAGVAVGYAAAFVIDLVMDRVVDYADGQTGFVDETADFAVDAYKFVKEGQVQELAADAYEQVKDMAGDVVDSSANVVRDRVFDGDLNPFE